MSTVTIRDDAGVWRTFICVRIQMASDKLSDSKTLLREHRKIIWREAVTHWLLCVASVAMTKNGSFNVHFDLIISGNLCTTELKFSQRFCSKRMISSRNFSSRISILFFRHFCQRIMLFLFGAKLNNLKIYINIHFLVFLFCKNLMRIDISSSML